MNDELILVEYAVAGFPLGRWIWCRVSCVMGSLDYPVAIRQGYCVVGIRVVQKMEERG